MAQVLRFPHYRAKYGVDLRAVNEAQREVVAAVRHEIETGVADVKLRQKIVLFEKHAGRIPGFRQWMKAWEGVLVKPSQTALETWATAWKDMLADAVTPHRFALPVLDFWNGMARMMTGMNNVFLVRLDRTLVPESKRLSLQG